MLHPGFAGELARALADDRVEGSGRRYLSSADRDRLAAREELERSARAFEAGLSLAAAVALLTLVLLGPGAALALTGAAAAGIVVARRPAPRRTDGRPPMDPEDRWGAWRRVEPDAEYLRGRAA